MSISFARASAAMVGPFTVSEIARTASKSPTLVCGNPPSMMSTPRRLSCSATSSFSLMFKLMPGDCSPSRSVVSKIVTLSTVILLVRYQQKTSRGCERLRASGPAGARYVRSRF